MNALEQQSQASESFWGTVAGVPREEPLSDAQVESAEMRSGTGTALQQTSFGRATDPAAPQLPEEEQRPLSDWEMEELEDQTVRDPSYIPTFNEWDSWDQKRAARSNAVNGFFQGAGSIASALGGVVWSLGKLPGDFVFRGFGPAYDTMVHSLAEGARRSGVGLAEIINYAGDVYADSSSDIRRSAAINDKIRQQLAAENKFTGNAQQDEAILEQAINEARAAGLYGRTPEETAAQAQEDRKTAYDRFVRNRALEQEFLGIDNFTMGNDPIETGRIFGPKTVGGQPSQITAESVTKRAYGIDDSKVDEGLATFGMLALDPLAILPMGAGGLSKLRALRRISILADKPLGGVAKSAGWAATKAENLQDRLMRAGLTSDRLAKASFGVAIGSGALGFSQNNDVAKGIALAAAVLPAVRKSGGILRGVESAAQSGQMVVKEMGVGGVGVFRADSASRLADDAAIPGRYREAMRGFFSGPESSLKRASQNEGMSLRARRTLGALDNTGVTQAFRLADDAVSGGLAGAAVASPFALIAPEDQQSQIFGAIATMGAAGGLIGGPLARRTQMIDADIARMLADVDAAGGDAAYFSQLPHETLARYAAMQGVVSTKVDWVPLSAQDYAANLAMPAASRETTKGLFVDASDGNRPRVFLDIDQLASGDVAGHEIGHAILKSDILGGEIKNNMRNQVNVQYGQDGVQARGREYLASIMAREVEAGVTGLKPEVLTDAEMQRVANGASPEDIVRARWEDPQMRQRMIDERIEDKNQRDLAEGNMEWDWARDEIAAETFSGLSGGIDFRRMREGGPLAGMLGAASGLFDMMGAKFRGNGRLETPNRVFEENPLFDTPEMRRAVTNYTKQFERYLVGMERDSAPKKRGTKVAPTGKASEAARSPHNRVYQNGAVVENDIFILDANGNPMPKSQQQVNTQEKARAATLKSINTRTRLVPVHSAEWGARKVGNRVEVGGPNLPLQFDNFVQVPQWLRTKAREFEAGRRTGQSYRVSYNAIGTGASGSYKVSNLGNVEAITREVVPFGWQLSDKNHLLAKVIDLDAFRAAAIRAVDRGELPEFNNNVKDVEAGLKVLLKNHEDGLPGETNLGAQKKNLLNGLLGTGTPTQKAANPLYGDLNPKGSIRTFRFDRLNYADPFGAGYFPHYHKINTNALPREVGVMSLDEWRQFDADRKSAYLNQQAARRGYSNSTNWQGADAAGFRAADAEYRREFPVPNERPAEGAALPRDARATPDAAPAGDQGVATPAGTRAQLTDTARKALPRLPRGASSVPKLVIKREGKADAVVDGGSSKNWQGYTGEHTMPLPNIKLDKVRGVSFSKQDIYDVARTDRARAQADAQQSVRAAALAAADPMKFVDPVGYSEIMRASGVVGDILIPPSGLKLMLTDPAAFVGLLDGGFHGNRTVPGTRAAAMQGLDGVMEMRQLTGGQPSPFNTALHHYWGTLSKQLDVVNQEAAWMRTVLDPAIIEAIDMSVQGKFNMTPKAWEALVAKALDGTKGDFRGKGNNAKANANSFYKALAYHNGRWDEVAALYANNNAIDMRAQFNALGHGKVGMKNKVQGFVGLSFGVKGSVLDRWRFVDLYLPDVMKLTSAATPEQYFKYVGAQKVIPQDPIGIYKNYGTLENGNPAFSLALYNSLDSVAQVAINNSPELRNYLGAHADPGGLHWVTWNSIKNEAVGHSSLDITKNFVRKYGRNGTASDFAQFMRTAEGFVEGSNDAGQTIRLSLKNGAFNYLEQ
jgi:hypothetical protein